MSLLLLLSSFTSLPPGAIVEIRCAKEIHRTLRYRDFELMLVPNLIPGRQDLLVMEITFVFLKRGYQSSNP